MFDALSGLKEALAAQENKPEPRRHLTEDSIAELNTILSALQKNQWVTIVYYCEYQQRVCQLAGPVTKIEPYWKTIQIGDICIDFTEIYEIIKIDKDMD